jgi:hypothetical protein
MYHYSLRRWRPIGLQITNIDELERWVGVDDYGELQARITELKALNHRKDD